MLSHSSAYAAYMVFKVAQGAYGLCSPYPETFVTLGGSRSTRQVCLDEDGDPWLSWGPMPDRGGRDGIPQNVLLPRERGDGWMELEMGEFQNDEGEDGEVSIKLMETSATESDRSREEAKTRAEGSMAEAPAPTTCEIARLPEDLLAASIAGTTPRDACRAAAVSPTFRAAADCDAVWDRFVPRDLPPLADGELSPAPPSKKALFMRLADGPVLLADGLTSMWLDRETGIKCYMLSARSLCIIWGDTPQYWRWIPLTDSRFTEGAELRAVCWLEIRGKIPCNMLSQNSGYAVYVVFKMSDESYGLQYPLQEASVTIGESRISRQVCLDGYQNEGEDDEEEVPQNHRSLRVPATRLGLRRRNRRVPHGVVVHFPKKRDDGWMEMELGQFNSEDGEDGEVSISLMETRGGNWKKGLIVQGIEIRAKK
ncbi:hypothetical protein HU200_041632 [Digitaria exilis]|uniref:F-box domain-containing protein n=1 Tax=Digitaria exilis TaxID=1010633 RepID=A0A835B8R5_9POAL|nr:hypothetical protein HU200_041632 [Digitaria exilis]